MNESTHRWQPPVVTAHATPAALRWWLEREACAQPADRRWRIVPTVGGARVYDDAAGTVTDYLINETWD